MLRALASKYVKYLMTLAMIGGLVYFCHPVQVWNALQDASRFQLAGYGIFGAIAAAFGAAALLVLFDFSRRRRWQLRFLSDYLYIQGVSQFTPAQLGELALPYLAARGRYPAAKIAAALVIQRISALLIIVFFALIGAGKWVPLPALWAASAIVCAICGGTLLVMLRYGKTSGGRGRNWFGVGKRLDRLLETSRAMLVQRGDRLAWHIVLMLLRYVASVLGNYVLLAAFDINVPVLDLAIITALAILTNLVPVTVGGIGLTEGIFAWALKTYGYAPSLTIAAVLSGRVVNAILALIWMLLYHSLPNRPRRSPDLARQS